MKVLITQQFNRAMQKLNNQQTQEVTQLYSFVTNSNKKNLFEPNLLTKILSETEEIYTLRGNHVRIFCTFDENDSVLFLDVSAVQNPNWISKGEEKKQEKETTLFGLTGDPKAYIAWYDNNTIYSFKGEPLAYIDEKFNIYGFNGNHLGWFEEGIVWDHEGKKVGFTKETSPTFTRFEPFKAFKKFKPFKSFKKLAPIKPFKKMSKSEVELLEFLNLGRRI